MIALVATHSAWALQPAGTYRHADVRGIELGRPGCERVWLETRTYQITPLDADNIAGLYGNIVLSIPVGIDVDQKCVYSLPASSPVSTQLRSWNLGGRRTSQTGWTIEAVPAPAIAEVGVGLSSEPFTAEIEVHGDSIIDRSAGLSPPEMRFVRERPVPDDLDAGLDHILRALHSGECASVISRMTLKQAPNREALIGEVCDLRRRISQRLGDYQSFRTLDVTILDGFRLPNRPYSVRESYFVGYLSQFSGGEAIPGHALIERDESGTLAPVLLW